MSDKIAFYSKDVSENLQIAASTLRKWSAMLEDAGYSFYKNDKGQRLYYEKDIVALRHLKRLTQDEGMTLESAVNEVVKRVKETEEIAQELAVPSDTTRYDLDDKLDRLLEYIKRQDERIERLERFNRELIEQNAKLLEAMYQVQQTQLMLAASQEETRQKKGLISRLFLRK